MKTEETVLDTVPLYEVPKAVSDCEESIGTMRCGYYVEVSCEPTR